VRTKVSDRVAGPERCRLPAATLKAVGVDPGQQVRLRCDGAPAVFTVDVASDTFGAVSPGGRDRLGASGGSFRVDIDPTVVHPTLTEATAAEEGGFIERRVGAETGSVVALAPHGGHIERNTDAQARRVAARLGVPAWYCAGYWPGGGAFDRWHVTSADLHPESFPELDALAGMQFEHAVSFHGWTESHVAVGGGASLELRESVRDAVDAAVEEFDVRSAEDPARDGSSPENVVNWLGAEGGIQIEQPHDARRERPGAIADAVAEALENR